MTTLDADVRRIMSAIPPGGCRLVTGHDSLGYFADRYGCTLVGAVIPSLSSSAETSAQALAELHDVAAAAGVRAIFTEVGTPTQIAEQVADEVGVELVELPSHDLPDAGGYAAYLTDLATRIATALAP
jgi:zinc/manganese transport system substrate-binding protein